MPADLTRNARLVNDGTSVFQCEFKFFLQISRKTLLLAVFVENEFFLLLRISQRFRIIQVKVFGGNASRKLNLNEVTDD